MALTTCKGCGDEIGKKAKSCPKCGEPVKRTHWFTWLVAVFFGLVLVGAIVDADKPQVNASSDGVAPEDHSDLQEIVVTSTKIPVPEKPKSKWYTFSSSDEMTGKFSAYTGMPDSRGYPEMEFPYGGVSASLHVGCSKKSEWAYFKFSQSPNLANTETEDGYNIIETTVRWDDKVESVRLRQNWGDSGIHFYNDGHAIKKIEGSSELLLRLTWHGQRDVHFKFSLLGSGNALKDMRTMCSQGHK